MSNPSKAQQKLPLKRNTEELAKKLRLNLKRRKTQTKKTIEIKNEKN